MIFNCTKFLSATVNEQILTLNLLPHSYVFHKMVLLKKAWIFVRQCKQGPRQAYRLKVAWNDSGKNLISFVCFKVSVNTNIGIPFQTNNFVTYHS
jgi:hypothetical protein